MMIYRPMDNIIKDIEEIRYRDTDPYELMIKSDFDMDMLYSGFKMDDLDSRQCTLDLCRDFAMLKKSEQWATITTRK
jgi:hypothetical protein